MSEARRRAGVLEVALVNNMPDAALAATHLQFSRLVRAGAGAYEISWRCYTLPGFERSESARRYLARSHEDIEALYRRGADAMIVTGCEPRAARLDQEPYWRQMQRLVDWARHRTLSTLWSCLAAHAATLHLAGIQRRRAPKKVSGVFRFSQCASDWAGAGAAEITVPHSRHNGLAREELEREGFIIGSFAPEVGVDRFWREEPSLFVFMQGHPEYDADTLLKEYRRDVLRYISGERADYPEQPKNYFSAQTSAMLEELRMRATIGADSDPADAVAKILAMEKRQAKWEQDSAQLFKNWLLAVGERARGRRESA